MAEIYRSSRMFYGNFGNNSVLKCICRVFKWLCRYQSLFLKPKKLFTIKNHLNTFIYWIHKFLMNFSHSLQFLIFKFVRIHFRDNMMNSPEKLIFQHQKCKPKKIKNLESLNFDSSGFTVFFSHEI